MQSANGRYVMTYNGEFYNYRELRSELEQEGHIFKGSSDSEVMLALFARDGVAKTLPRLFGMFAIALWDRQDRKLTLIRDRLGIKPLYFGQQGSKIYWGSELKCFRAHPAFDAAVNLKGLDAYLKGNMLPAPLTIYEDVKALAPGRYLEISFDGTQKEHIYWSLADILNRSIPMTDQQEALQQVEDTLEDAVRLRMIADVPLGAMLSGGVDSSTVVALMQKISSRPVKTFTIGFDDKGYNEADHAAAVANHLGTDHTRLDMTTRDAMDLIPNMPDWYDEPFADSSALPTYLVSRLAKTHVTVALSGDGGDEALFGYNRHRILNKMAHRLDSIPFPLRKLAASTIAAPGPAFWEATSAFLPQKIRPGMAGTKMQKLAGILAARDTESRYRSLLTHWPEDLTGMGGSLPLPDHLPAGDPAARAAFADTLGYLPNDILTKVDRASMAVSLEARVPLLDHRVIELAWRLPTSLKIRKGISKWPLRHILYQYVPKALVDRPKAGFAIPLDDWLRGPLREWAETLLSEDRLRQRGWIDPIPVRAAWKDHLARRGARAEALWGICMLESWADRWIGSP
jgi:asparagine synthase (glutamine-hydrolysing)